MGGQGGIFRFADWVDKVLLLFGILGSIGDGLMSPLTMYVLSGVINDYGGENKSFSKAVVDEHALKLLYVAIFVGVSAFVEGVCWTRTAERQTSRMRMEYLKSVLRQEVGFFDTQANSSATFQVVSTISSDAHLIQDVISEKIPNALMNFSTFIFSIVVSFILSWRLALYSFPFCLMFIVPALVFGKMLMGLGIKMKDAYGVAGGIAEQAIWSIRTVYAYVGENQTLNRFSQALEKSLVLGVKGGLIKGFLIGSMGIVFATWAFQTFVGTNLVTEKGESGGRVFVSGICTVLGGIAIMSVLPNLSAITAAKAAATKMFEIIDRKPLIDSEDTKGKILLYVKATIEFKEVTFSYPSRPDTLILQGLNLRVKAGKTVGLVGGSGSGKSTIISLLERFYDPIKGDILLDGHNIKRLQLKWLRTQMGLVNQEPVLFATTIKENILFGNEEAPMERVVSAAKAANAHDFIVGLPLGYESHVGQFGFQLSGGQKQRIAIARAILRDPKILLLDEATSALDAESERTVQEALDLASNGRTTIIVAHRLSTIRKADKIVVLQSGVVVESGTHDELMQTNKGEGGGAYANMVQLQRSSAQNETSTSRYFTPENDRKSITIDQSPRMTPRHSYRYETSPRSSWQSNSGHLTPFTPVFSISVPNSYRYKSDDSDIESIDEYFSYHAPSTWRLLKLNSPEWKRGFLGCLGAAVFGAIGPINSYCLGSVASVYFSDDVSKIRSETKIYKFVFLTLAVLCFISNVIQNYNFAIVGERLTKRVREKLLSNMLTFEIGWFDEDENTSAAICSRIASEANMVRSLIGDRASLLIQVGVSAVLAFAIGLAVTWRIALVMIAMQPLIIGSLYSRNVLMRSLSKKAQKTQNEGSQLASEAVVNHRTISAFSSEKRILSLFASTMEEPRKQSVRLSWFSGFGLFASQFLTTASIAMTYWYGGWLISKGQVSSQHLFQAFFILMSTGKNIADAGSATADLAKGAGAVKSVFAILDRKTDIEPNDLKGAKIEKAMKGSIELKNVFFAYPTRPDLMIFQGLNLKIEAGKTVALVGQSGSGKSTVIGLVERFYDPIKGSVFIDGQDIRTYNLRSLRSQIALVSQEPTLFGGTIYENIVYGKEGATESEVRDAATLANAHEFISSMKDGYNTNCGERGVQLSGGQKQRIALARAILKSPTILLLDEATSALDSVSENLVQEALEKMMIGRTCVVVAHRLSTIKKADTIAVINNGIVVEKGSHADLISVGTNGAYFSLVKLQNGQSPYR